MESPNDHSSESTVEYQSSRQSEAEDMEIGNEDLAVGATEQESELQQPHQETMHGYDNNANSTGDSDYIIPEERQNSDYTQILRQPISEINTAVPGQNDDVIIPSVDLNQDPDNAQSAVDMNEESGNAAQDATDDEIDLSHYNLRRVEQDTLFNVGQYFAGVEYNTVQCFRPSAVCSDVWPQVDPLELGVFRRPNGISLPNLATDVLFDSSAIYGTNHPPGAPIREIERTREVLNTEGLKERVVEGLCAYCGGVEWLDKSSVHGHHLLIHHGVLTDGQLVPDPVDASFYYSRQQFSHPEHLVFQAVRCPVEGCNTICRLSVPTTANPTGAHDYLLHYGVAHQTLRPRRN